MAITSLCQTSRSPFRLAIAVFLMSTGVGASSWPMATPLSRTFVIRDAAHAAVTLDIHGADGRRLYRIDCRTFRFEDDRAFSYSGDFECRLFPLYTDTPYSTLFTDMPHPTRDWQSRARFLLPELVGKCATYAEYGRVRNFRLRGMTIRLALSDVRTKPSIDNASGGVDALKSFHFRVDVRLDGGADSEIAEPVHGPEPPPICGAGYRSPGSSREIKR